MNVVRLSQLVMRFSFLLVIDSKVHWTFSRTASTMKGSFPLFVVRYCDTICIAQMTTTFSHPNHIVLIHQRFPSFKKSRQRQRGKKMACCQHSGFIYAKVVSIQLNYCLKIRFYSIKFSQVFFVFVHLFFISFSLFVCSLPNDSLILFYLFLSSMKNTHFFRLCPEFFLQFCSTLEIQIVILGVSNWSVR